MDNISKRINGAIPRDGFVLDDEYNPKSSRATQVYLSTTLDQVFDDTDPTKKTLRQIIEELKVDILTGGRGNIEFPVTSVNGQTGDVLLNKRHLNMDKVDNTADVDKPLSVPQKTAIMEILSAYDYNINLQDLYDHIANKNNPHEISLDQINFNGEVETLIRDMINRHNVSTNQQAHVDIRNRLSALWNRVDNIDNTLEDRLHNVLRSLEEHLQDIDPHTDSFGAKEDIKNKIHVIDSDANHVNYPTALAVVQYVLETIAEFRNTLPDVENWIDDIQSVDNRSELPAPTSKYYRKAYFIREGVTSSSEIAICRRATNKIYVWEYHNIGAYSKFNTAHFIDTPSGMDINMRSIVSEILENDGGVFQEIVANNYYNKDQIDAMHLVNDIKILPGTQNGTIRYYINDDLTTMTDDIRIPGLQRLAYLEWVTENELKDNAVRSKHVIDGAIEERHLQDRIIDLNKFKCGTYGTILGNTIHPDHREVHEIKLIELADYLRPLIGGWPDPNTPGGNPWSDMLRDQVPHHHLMRPNTEHNLMDRSYIKRFTGVIDSIANYRTRVLLDRDLVVGPYKIIDAGGTWCYQSDPEEWTMLGGSNITGHTFATVTMTQEGSYLETISIGERRQAPYDVWIRYVKPEELVEGEYEPI